MSKQNLWAGLTVAMLSAAAVLWVTQQGNLVSEIKVNPPVAIGPARVGTTDGVASESQLDRPPGSSASQARTHTVDTTAPLTAQQLSNQLEPQREEWRRAHGLISEEMRDRYRALGDDELRKLAAAGISLQ